MTLLVDLSTSAGAVLVLAASGWLGYLLAYAALPDARASLRLSATVSAALAVLLAAFLLLTTLHLFARGVGVPFLVGCAGVAHWRSNGARALERLREDLGAARRRLASLTSTAAGGALTAVAIAGAARICKGLAAPPTAWDSMTYHLVRPALWIQSGYDYRPKWPDAFAYFGQLPVAGDAVWAWAMLPCHGDDFVAVAGLLLIAGCLLGTYAAAIGMGAGEIEAALAASAVVLMPAVMNLCSTGYVDNLSLCALVGGAALLADHATRPTPGTAALAMGALAVGAATKVHMTAPMAFGLGVIAWHCRRDRRARVLQPLAAIAVAGPLLAGYARTWLATGSPIYPVYLPVGGAPLFPYNAEYRTITESARQVPTLWSTAREMVFSGFLQTIDSEPQGFGPLVPVLALVGAGGALLALWRDPRRRAVVLALLGTVLVFYATFAASSMRGQRTWGANIARYFTPGLAGLLVLGAVGKKPLLRATYLTSALLGLLLTVPRNVIGVEAEAMLGVVWVVGTSLVGTLAAVWLARRWAPRWVTAVALVGALVGAARIPSLRATHRHAIFAALTRTPPFYDLHQLAGAFSEAYPIWAALDDGAPHRIAVAAGHVALGHNWYRYPLFGRRLQNELVYVPILRSGAVESYRTVDHHPDDPPDLRSWLRRLREANVEFVVTLAPDTVERTWGEQHPELFRTLHRTRSGNAAFAVNRAALDKQLSN